MSLIVQKYGGATLATPEKIKAVARRISELHTQGNQLIIVVSAMGKTTNQLIDLANQVSHNPLRRELDMLLSTGERISMSLLSMALNDLGTPAISFTGSQAGVLTDESHLNAFIKEVRPQRVQEALAKKQVVVLAGFQGVSPVTKEITTLGRGGSDTTAVAMAAALNASRCEILKDVPAVFSADPQIISEARPIKELSYPQLMDMTFWGAKVLHYRSVELGMEKSVPLYIGPAHSSLSGTTVLKEVIASNEQIISLNSHEVVIKINCSATADITFKYLQDFLQEKQIAYPQILRSGELNGNTQILLTGPNELTSALLRDIVGHTKLSFQPQLLSTVTATFSKAGAANLEQQILKKLADKNIHVLETIKNPIGLTLLLSPADRVPVIQSLHKLIYSSLS